MIEKIECFRQFDEYKNEDLYTVRIKALAQAYGFGYDFAVFYRQIINGRCAAVICRLDSDAVISLDFGLADVSELSSFFAFRGFSSLLCDDSFQLDREYDSGVVMKSESVLFKECRRKAVAVKGYEELKMLYEFTGYAGGFEAWYADISRRIRTKTAAACAVFENGEIISAAVLSSLYNGSAVLSGVKTKPEYRKAGIAGAVVSKLCRASADRVYIMREQNKNESFYEELGFKNTGKWRIYR